MRNKHNFKRDQILNENLLQYKNDLKMQIRDIEIVELYVKGVSLKDVAYHYQISAGRVDQIINNFIRHSSSYKYKIGMYREREPQ